MSADPGYKSQEEPLHRGNGLKDSAIVVKAGNGSRNTPGKGSKENLEKDTSDKKDDDSKETPALPPVPFFALFQHASCLDRFLIFLGCLAGLVSSGSFPAVFVLLGELMNVFIGHEMMSGSGASDVQAGCGIGNATNFTTANSMKNETFIDEFERKRDPILIAMGGIALGSFISNYVMVTCLGIAAENQAYRIRQRFMQAILRQDIAWFDTHQTGDFSSRITADLDKIRDGINEKIGMCVYFMASALASVIMAFVYGWKMTLVVLSTTPVLIVTSAIMAKVTSSVSSSELDAYGKAGAVAEEVFSSIRTVVAFGGEAKEIQRYDKNLAHAQRNGIKKGIVTSVSAGILWFCFYGAFALAFWYGVKLILDSCHDGSFEYKPGTLIIVLFGALSAAMAMGQCAPYFEAISTARGAAALIFEVIKRVPPIDSSSESGVKPDGLEGVVKLENVNFFYPARPEVQVLDCFSIQIRKGETVALVGPSGCGKSTVIQLIQRFYDPQDGKVLLDGLDVKELNVGWLRDHIGVVGQEPVLFATTIAENIRYGWPSATAEDIERAARIANAHDFIMALPKTYDTEVGQRGAQLSGGQKQRIAIARAIIKNPKILLLDEATSALDSESESVVQAALDKAQEGRTTIIVAHRLSTIRSADKIMVISKGRIQELGTHHELMAQEGLYFQLVTSQLSDLEAEDTVEFSVPRARSPTLTRRFSRQDSTLSRGSGRGSISGSIEGMKGVTGISHPPLNPDLDDLEEEELKERPSLWRLFKLTSPEWPLLFIGSLSAFGNGVSMPAYGIMFGSILGVLTAPTEEEIHRNANLYSMIIALIGVVSGFMFFLQTFMFALASERLTSRIRKLTFAAVIRQEIGWFDMPKNNTGALCSRLSSDAANVQGAMGSRLATVSQALSTLAASIAIAVYYNYKLGLVALAFIPVVLLATYCESRVMTGQIKSEKTSVEGGSKIAVEAIQNIRTVASLHQERNFHSQYVLILSSFQRETKLKCHLRGLMFGFSQSLVSVSYSVLLYYGSVLMVTDNLSFSDMFKVIEAIMLGTMVIGQAVAFAPDYLKAQVSMVRIYKLLDRQPEIDYSSPLGLMMDNVSGKVDYKSVIFHYPSRPEVTVLRALSLTVEPGKTVALVGGSGCGKSTCVQLLGRFYDVVSGSVALDNNVVTDLHVAWLRSQIGIVSQEPVLFACSIRDNMAYGINTRPVTMDEIVSAAEQANIHEFIKSLPAGYDTTVGDKGTQLSGGQKQRVAIARAIIRNPKLLLLDEATSALDSESEKVVQEALDKASEGRTCIMIAHRLSTVQNADVIVVIRKGRVAEMGTHHELLAKKGFYYSLYMTQVGSNT